MSPMARAWVDLGPYLNIGWMFVASISVFAALGWWLDGKLESGRKLFIAGCLFGIIVGFANLYKVVLQMDRKKS